MPGRFSQRRSVSSAGADAPMSIGMQRLHQRALLVGLTMGACLAGCAPGAGGLPSAGGAGGAAAGAGGAVAPRGGAIGTAGASAGNGGAPSGDGGAAAGTGGATAGRGGADDGGRGGGASAGTGGATAGRGGANDAGRGGGAAGGAGGTAGGGGSGAGGATAGRGGGGASGSGGAADPGSDGDGDFTIGPTYTKQTDLMSRGALPGKSFNFTMSSPDSTIFTGLDTTLNAPKAFTRRVDVYVPAKYKDGTAAPFVVIQDGPGQLGSIRNALDNLTQDSTPSDRRLPAFVAIAVANGGGDSLGSERGLEYDTMSDRYARFIDTEVLPTVRANAQIKAAYPNLSFTTDPDGRAAIGCSSGGAAAMTMGWFKPDLFHRLITYSGTFVDQQDTDAPEEKMFPLGAWEYHTGLSLIANSDPKPLRVFVNANEMDNGYNQPESGHHNWLLANQRMAAAFKAKGYHYRYVFGMGAGHCDGKVQDATLADTLVWAWRGYPINW